MCRRALPLSEVALLRETKDVADFAAAIVVAVARAEAVRPAVVQKAVEMSVEDDRNVRVPSSIRRSSAFVA